MNRNLILIPIVYGGSFGTLLFVLAIVYSRLKNIFIKWKEVVLQSSAYLDTYINDPFLRGKL